MTEFTHIPIIDLSQSDAAITRDFAKAYGKTGFGYISNHAIPQALIDSVLAASAAFHALPEPEKQTIALNHVHRGYIPINTSTDVNSKLATVKKPNQSSSFMMMREDAFSDPDIFLSGPNQWPDLPDFRETLEAYVTAMSALGYRLMRHAALACGANPLDILPAFETPTLWLRLLHYPPSPAQSPDDLYGSAPHTDFGALTILAQDDIGGLQVQTPSGAWVDAPRIPGTLVVNVGDMLHRLSNGMLKSTPHRVINRAGQARYSIPFFYDPHVATTVNPLPGTGAAKFAALHFGDFLRAELGAAYDAHKKNTKT
jgi:isopenicillin N synthase-like dioxygenase